MRFPHSESWGLHGSGVAQAPGLPSRALAVLRSSLTPGPELSESKPIPTSSHGAGPSLLCSSPLARPHPTSPAVRCSHGFHPPSTRQRRPTLGRTRWFSLGPSCPPGDMGRCLGTCVVVTTGVLLVLRGGGRGCCSATSPQEWSGQNVHSAEGQRHSGTRPGRLTDEGDDKTRGLAWWEQGQRT